ncbi:MAG: hypothetical protein COV97_01740 [Zetaproteobacteria bacterium CG11_big_fil_rev_8_21_14_0_20_59_439]|nr:MAG: hypothetical protein AUK36_00525 [Zetaproteobacteria bacterium CG2_30_59_37]PIO89551.1 MAG: hypothetical protein COX56_06805 [Zetaproteobacteria bacterium CG23_combo_of_CG06-09_8_20_14_all_59_86]PIQ65783.1 MAG: hypothetical protein COV97_01740 [Zetaproteobacteria bacterium CG11_big_fil_rev_8_21_14_0_20_59_439]PIU97087.1 MAG: hypothetical protein COS62_05100 [Zetaproteobacteria bacterium CG03_land_8_20_14_0_80_59_51]PIY46499.1 MAG: hypothetical protein COZ02_05825 [Zetaproteobacteria bac
MMLPSPILVVCAGNLCRSPFAEGVFRNRLEQAGVYAEVFSRGLLDVGKQPVPQSALKVAKEFGVDLSEHHAAQLKNEDLQRAGIVLVMSARQRRHIGGISPTAFGKVFLLSQPDDGEAVEDPIGKPDSVFHEVYHQINQLAGLWLQRFGVSS